MFIYISKLLIIKRLLPVGGCRCSGCMFQLILSDVLCNIALPEAVVVFRVSPEIGSELRIIFVDAAGVVAVHQPLFPFVSGKLIFQLVSEAEVFVVDAVAVDAVVTRAVAERRLISWFKIHVIPLLYVIHIFISSENTINVSQKV